MVAVSTAAPASSHTAPPSGTGPAAPGRPVGTRRWSPSPRWAARILMANLVGQVGIIGTGGAVRLTGSGLGCSTWPQCEPGQFTPVMHEAVTWHPFIEFGNRTLTGVLGVLGLATVLVVWSRTDRSRAFRLLGLVPLLGVVLQAVIGGVTVLLDLHPAVVGVHFLVSMGLVAASAALVVRNREGDGPPVRLASPAVRRLSKALVPVAAVVVGLGVLVTGSGPYSGDEEIAYRLALDPVAMAKVHAAAVWLYGAGVVALVILVHRGPAQPRVRRGVLVLVGVTLLQGAIGYVQYFTGLPQALVAAHMIGAALLVVAQTNQVLALRERPTVDGDAATAPPRPAGHPGELVAG